ncbi:MAG TPA: phospho-sugar mutase [Myxococcota bacterium]|nr:phospho-sugar mutase [Myxococcota bacterium]
MTELAIILEKKCRDYLLEEPDTALRTQIHQLLAAKEAGFLELENRLMRHLSFGTAGLRGRMEAGYNRMNLVTVYRFCYALGVELKKTSNNRRVVIGYDARENSELFAKEASRILAAMGADARLFTSYVPTPLCAYAVKNLSARAGIMITASHNPKWDNGIKLFAENSAQAYGPILTVIEQKMAHAPLRNEFFETHQHSLKEARVQEIDDEVFKNYLSDIKKTKLFNDDEIDSAIKVVYTPLHGVGQRFFLAAASQEGFGNVTLVEAQSEPNGQFPSVCFPNPEENHTLDLAWETARAHDINWVFANDPDADRLQVSVRDENQEWRRLTGNEMGSILGYFAINRALLKGIKPLVASSIVSSRMLRAMSEQLGATYVDALTGFSNIVFKALETQKASDCHFIYGYEEAIGFLVDQVVLDKDGINAGLRFLEIAGFLKKSQQTVSEFVATLYQQFGIFVNDQWSVRFEGVNGMRKMASVMAAVRALPSEKMADMLSQSEVQKYDLNEAQKNNSYEGMQADVIIFEINPFLRLIVRPSGTEPKIKFYLELFEKVSSPQRLMNQKSVLERRLREFRSKLAFIL